MIAQFLIVFKQKAERLYYTKDYYLCLSTTILLMESNVSCL